MISAQSFMRNWAAEGADKLNRLFLTGGICRRKVKNIMKFKTKVIAIITIVALLVTQSCLFAFAESAAPTAVATAGANGQGQNPGCGSQQIIMLLVYVVLIGAMFYFLIFRPQKKRKKEEEEMKNSIVLGVDVVTIGGICGKIINIKDDTITIQSSIDNTLIEFKSWAIREIKKPVSDEENAK